MSKLHSKTRKTDSSNLYCWLQYLPMRALMVSTAITVVGAMPPKLKVQSLIFHELLHRSLSNNTLMQVLTMAISPSRLRDCLKANTYSCCKQSSKKLYYINWSALQGFLPLRKTMSPHAKNYNTFSCVFENSKIIHDICLEINLIPHLFAALTCETLSWTLDKFHISVHPCIILFVLLSQNYP